MINHKKQYSELNQHLLNLEKSPLIKKIKDDLIYNILSGNLKNDEDILIECNLSQ